MPDIYTNIYSKMNTFMEKKLKSAETFMGKFGCWCSCEVTPYMFHVYISRNFDHIIGPPNER